MQLVIPEVELTAPEEGGTKYNCGQCQKDHVRITTMLDATCPKFGLVPWGERTGQTAMQELARQGYDITTLAPQRIKELTDQQGINTDKLKTAGGSRGTATHTYLATYIDTGTVPDPEDYADEYQPYLRQLSRFLIDYRPEFLASEVTVAHHGLDYAGRFDGICIIRKQPPRRNKPVNLTGKRCLFDLKTNKEGRVYVPEQFYQVAGYEYAWRDMGCEPNDHQIVVALGAENYQAKVSYFDPESIVPLANFYHDQQRQKAKNPNGRKKNG